MKVGLLTREWPPEVYGGAGVHVVNLTSALRELDGVVVDVHCFGSDRPGVNSYAIPQEALNLNPALQALTIDLEMAERLGEVDVIHSHTWYTNMAGTWGSALHGKPHVITAHSLEPLRPWKEEQLGGGYRVSSWAESSAYLSADAIIAVSDGMRADVLATYPDLDPAKVHTIRNGVDTSAFTPTQDDAALQSFGIEGPYAIFVGRITRQKGLAHLLRAWRNVPSELGLVLAASSPDEPHVGEEVHALILELQEQRKNVVWIKEMLSRSQLIALLSAARLAVVPSIYEPLGIVNLEAMACGTAVVASNVGGIPEVVHHGVTGELVERSTTDVTFEESLATAVTRVGMNPDLCLKYGAEGRLRAVSEFSWRSVAHATAEVYRSVLR